MSMFQSSIPYNNNALAATKKQVKAGLAFLFALRVVNTTGSDAYLQMFNKAAADVTVGTTTPDIALHLGANETLLIESPVPIEFSNGLTLAGTTTSNGGTGATLEVFAAYQ